MDTTDGNSEGSFSADFEKPEEAVKVFEDLLNLGGRQRDMAKRIQESRHKQELAEQSRRNKNI